MFAQLGDLDHLAREFQGPYYVPPGAVLFNVGETGDFLYFLLAGEAVARRGKKKLRRYRRGGFLGEASLFGAKPTRRIFSAAAARGGQGLCRAPDAPQLLPPGPQEPWPRDLSGGPRALALFGPAATGASTGGGRRLCCGRALVSTGRGPEDHVLLQVGGGDLNQLKYTQEGKDVNCFFFLEIF